MSNIIPRRPCPDDNGPYVEGGLDFIVNNLDAPPPEAFGITSCTRGNLSLVDALSGFYLHHNQGENHWLSDGVDMFVSKDYDPISLGTMEWWYEAYHWLGDEDYLMEVYFPEVKV